MPTTSSDIRQSAEFASFMSDIGWQTLKLNGQNCYLKKIPLLGFFAKCPRPDSAKIKDDINSLIREKNIFRFKISPFIRINQQNYKSIRDNLLKKGFKIDRDPFNPTTSITLDLKKSEEILFAHMKEAKRRGVRRAIKNGIKVFISDDISAFIAIRKRQFNPMGFIVEKEMKMLWKNFYPGKATLLMATGNKKTLAGILLLFHKKYAYYWYASSLNEGKKLFAPTMLVWEAIREAKKKNCEIFDFEGVYDDRFPKASKNWRGFTKFKEGFSGRKVIYMENFFLKRPIIRL